MKYIVIWGVVAPLSGLAAGILAAARGRDHSYWAAWCFVAPPLLLVLALLPRATFRYTPRRSIDDDDNHD
ncbi:MAG TPA: hypothetical protein PK264_10575 [Hyphomicrobiaceae bacterium]|nr:hypothetical protein [Hyphomicrobiaceae bacterium]